jgi:hypothetical protein
MASDQFLKRILLLIAALYLGTEFASWTYHLMLKLSIIFTQEVPLKVEDGKTFTTQVL